MPHAARLRRKRSAPAARDIVASRRDVAPRRRGRDVAPRGETPAEGIEPTVTLNDGRRMPTSIIGTFVGDDEAHTSPESCRQLVRDALAAGFRHFDTATVYGNEEELGRALRDAPDVFVTTKVAHPNNDRGEWWTLAPWVSDASLDATEGVLQAVRDARARLDRPVSLVLLHWPGPFGNRDAVLGEQKRWDMWRGLMAARREGLCDSIGVASFTQTHLEQLIARAPEVLPAVNQAEVHPRNANVDLVEFCQQKGIVVCAWSPLGLGAKMNLFEDPTLLAIAQRHGVSPAAVALRWLAQRNIIPLPRTVRPSRMRENLDVVLTPKFRLSDDEMADIYAMDEGRTVFPGARPDDIA